MADLSPQTWAATLLKRLGIHQTPGAVQALAGWAKAEGGHWVNDARFNPLNTTQKMPGAGNTGTQGNIKVYKSWEQGLDATVKTLQYPAYKGIIAALKSGSPGAVADAIGKTPWGTSGDLVRRTIASTSPASGVQADPALASGGGGGASSGGGPAATGATSSASSTTPGSTAGVTALLAAMQQPQQARAVAGLQAPAFSARPTLAGGSQVPVSGGGPAPTGGVDGLLAAASAIGQQQTDAPAAGDAPADAGGGSGPAGTSSPIAVGGGHTLATTFGGVTERIKAGDIPHVSRASDVKNLQGVVGFDGKPVAAWVGYVLDYARKHGWKGALSEGYRTDKQQTGIYNSGVRPAAKPKSLGGGGSNHSVETFPGGAADVSMADQLDEILRRSPYGSLLQWAGSKDPVHFSHPHGGSY